MLPAVPCAASTTVLPPWTACAPATRVRCPVTGLTHQVLRPDVASVKVRHVHRNPDRTEEVGTPLFVMAKEDGQWRLTACQDTSVLSAD
ncbi:hypothetical protein GCM10023334_099620 [Nonomuraea thailandensis]